ncbi:MAG: hypothetical protein ACQEST_07505 [Bacteroidota bacterium]
MTPEKSGRVIKIKMKENAGKKKSFIVPGHQKLKREESINWEMEDSGAIFFFPRKELFGKSEFQVSKGETLSLTISKNAQKGEYPYAVFTDNNDFAEGGSFPKLIID